MEQNVIEAIDGISAYPIISLIIFVLFFTGIVIWMMKADKNHLKKMSELPIEDDNFYKEPAEGKTL